MAHFEIDEVKPALKGVNHGPSGWGFAVYSDIVGDDAPYRDVLTGLVASGHASVSLPERMEGEDCVEGSLTWADHRIDIYFEIQALSYLALWSLDRAAVEAVRAELSHHLL